MAVAGAASSSAGPEQQAEVFCFCARFRPGLPWSESLGTGTFSAWMENFCGQEGLHIGKDLDFFNAFHEPNDRLDEFVTGRALSPGQNPLLKPPSVWLGTEPTDGDTKTIKSAKLVLRTLRSKIDIPPDSVRCPFPPTKFETLWIAVKLLKGR